MIKDVIKPSKEVKDSKVEVNETLLLKQLFS